MRSAKKAEDGTLAVPAADRVDLRRISRIERKREEPFRFFFRSQAGAAAAENRSAGDFDGIIALFRAAGDDPRPRTGTLSETAVPGRNRFGTASPKVTVYPTANTGIGNGADLRAAEKIDRRRPDSNLKRIGIVISDPASLIPFIQGVVSRFDQDEQPLPFNLTLGYPETDADLPTDRRHASGQGKRRWRHGAGHGLSRSDPPSLHQTFGRGERGETF